MTEAGNRAHSGWRAIARRARAFARGAGAVDRSLWPFLFIISLFALMALLSPWIAPADPLRQNLLGRLAPPLSEIRGVFHLLGTDELGRDIASRIVYGARVSLAVAFLSVLLSGAAGATLGMLAAYRRGLIETLVMRLVDVFLSIPAILLAIITVAVLGPGLWNVVLVLALTRWPRYARVAYGQTLSIAGRPFLQYADYVGASTRRQILVHILPNIVGALIVVATLEFGLMVLFEAGLSFLGLGVQPPTPSWGGMLSVGKDYVASAWWLAAAPGLCLFLLVLAVNVVGDRLSDQFELRVR